MQVNIFAFLFSPYALLAVLMGLLLFVTMSFIPAVTRVGRTLCNIHLWLGMWCVKRAAIVVSEHGEILFKRMKFDDLGVERIKFGTETKEFEDPAQCLHHWMGFPFALADEGAGVFFDPRYAYAGAKKGVAEEKGEWNARATDKENQAHGVDGWIRGVFEIPKTSELVDLTQVRRLLRGGERAEYPGRAEAFYEKSQMHNKSKLAWLRLALPVIAFIGIFAGMWWVSDQAAQSGARSTVGFNQVLWLLAGAPLREYVTWKRAIAAVLVLLGVAPFLAILVFFGPVMLILVVVLFTVGFLFVPILTVVASFSAGAAQNIAKLYLKFGFFGYTDPVFVWTKQGYELKDYEQVGDVGEINWYSLAGSRVGFTFEPEEESFEVAALDQSYVEGVQEEETNAADTNVPNGYVIAPSMRREMFAGFVPKRIKSNRIYVHSGIILSRFADAARGERTLRKLTKAKEKYGGGSSSIEDATLLKYTVGAGLLAVVLGVVIFFL